MHSHRFPLFVTATWVVAIATAASAQPPRPDGRPHQVAAESGYGIDDLQISVVGYDAMLPYHVWVGFNSVGGGYVTAFTQGNFVVPKLQASLNALLPNGARLESLCLYGYDGEADPGVDLSLTLVRNIVNMASGQNPEQETLATIETGDAPGDGAWCSPPLDIPIIYQFDYDNDNISETMTYSLVVEFTASDFGLEQGFRMAVLEWRREVRPAPETASFADVPVGSSYHRWVEAAAAAGIMQACDGNRAAARSGGSDQAMTAELAGNFCPDNPVTRGQLALYLARALGLHWPAFGIGYVP